MVATQLSERVAAAAGAMRVLDPDASADVGDAPDPDEDWHPTGNQAAKAMDKPRIGRVLIRMMLPPVDARKGSVC